MAFISFTEDILYVKDAESWVLSGTVVKRKKGICASFFASLLICTLKKWYLERKTIGALFPKFVCVLWKKVLYCHWDRTDVEAIDTND